MCEYSFAPNRRLGTRPRNSNARTHASKDARSHVRAHTRTRTRTRTNTHTRTRTRTPARTDTHIEGRTQTYTHAQTRRDTLTHYGAPVLLLLKLDTVQLPCHEARPVTRTPSAVPHAPACHQQNCLRSEHAERSTPTAPRCGLRETNRGGPVAGAVPWRAGADLSSWRNRSR